MRNNCRVVIGLTVLVSALLTGCATMVTNEHTPPPPLVQHHPPATFDELDVLAVTPAMESFLERYVLPYGGERLRLSLLMLAVTDKGVLGFHYNQTQTLTAAEAFRRRSGNCVAFANLFVALARGAGLDARYQEVYIEPEWSSRGDTLLVTKHMNVLVRIGYASFMVDVSGQKISFDSRRRLLSDEEALSLHYNNLGADALIAGDYSAGYGWFTHAIETAPTISDPWSNLGVLFSRNGQFADAEVAYLNALGIYEREMAAMGNLHDLYVEQGRLQEAALLERRVERYRRENPYYLMFLAEEAVKHGTLAEAEKLLKEAIGLKASEHRLHYAMARVAFLLGDEIKAEASLQKARELAPPEVLVEYQRPLEEVVWRERDRPFEPLSR